VEGGKQENPEKNLRSKGENQQQTQPMYDVGSRTRTRDTLVGGECSHHCATPVPHGIGGHRKSTYLRKPRPLDCHEGERNTFDLTAGICIVFLKCFNMTKHHILIKTADVIELGISTDTAAASAVAMKISQYCIILDGQAK